MMPLNTGDVKPTSADKVILMSPSSHTVVASYLECSVKVSYF